MLLLQQCCAAPNIVLTPTQCRVLTRVLVAHLGAATAPGTQADEVVSEIESVLDPTGQCNPLRNLKQIIKSAVGRFADTLLLRAPYRCRHSAAHSTLLQTLCCCKHSAAAGTLLLQTLCGHGTATSVCSGAGEYLLKQVGTRVVGVVVYSVGADTRKCAPPGLLVLSTHLMGVAGAARVGCQVVASRCTA